MARSFNELLAEVGIPAADVSLMRHTGKRVDSNTDRTPYDMWRDDRPMFDRYQSIHKERYRKTLNAPLWAVFCAGPDKDTLFLGLYNARYLGPFNNRTWPISLGILEGPHDKYQLMLDERLGPWIGRLRIEWGKNPNSWIQHASRQDKPIINSGNERAVSEDLEALLRQPNVSPTTTRTLVEARLGQGKFRSDVLALWNGECAVTGAATLVAIRASHIKPWCKSTDAERLDPHNGLPLVASLDALFDAGLISFDDSGAMLISSELAKRDREVFGLSGRKLTKKPSQATLAYLRGHRTSTFKQ